MSDGTEHSEHWVHKDASQSSPVEFYPESPKIKTRSVLQNNADVFLSSHAWMPSQVNRVCCGQALMAPRETGVIDRFTVLVLELQHSSASIKCRKTLPRSSSVDERWWRKGREVLTSGQLSLQVTHLIIVSSTSDSEWWDSDNGKNIFFFF